MDARVRFEKTREESDRDFERMTRILESMEMPEYTYDRWGHHPQVGKITVTDVTSEVSRFLTYCAHRGLKFDSLNYASDRKYELTCTTHGGRCLAGVAPTMEEALDNLNIALQAHLRRKIDALCEELKELEDMEI